MAIQQVSMSFNHTAMVVDLRKHLIAAMLMLQRELLNEAKQGMRTPDGAADLSAENIKDVAGVLSAVIVGGPWTILDEFGTGSLMDTDNSLLDRYRGSPLWNPARHDSKIRGRPAGSQQTMFGERTFKGNAAGVDLEKLAQAGVIDEKYLPQSPSKALRTAMRWMAVGRFQAVITGVLKSFPFGNYLVIKAVGR